MLLTFRRQVPKSWLELVVSSCGGVVGWEGEGSPFSSADPGITHQVGRALRQRWQAVFLSNKKGNIYLDF